MSAGPSLRVVAGDLRGRRFHAPPGDGTRPTPDRVREAVFNALGSLGAIEDAHVLDGYGGSGALGIEALSRGASSAVFVDTDPAARRVLTDNLTALDLLDRAEVRRDGALRALASATWDLILLDPPHAAAPWPELLDAVSASLAPDGIAVLESDHEVPLPGRLASVRTRTYGGTVVVFAARPGAFAAES